MNTGIYIITFTILSLICLSHSSIDDVGEVSHGGHGLKEYGIVGKDHEGTGYGGHKGGVPSKGYGRGFSYGTGHGIGKSVSYGDMGYNGKGYADKEFRGYGLGGLGYRGFGIGGYRAPFFYFR